MLKIDTLHQYYGGSHILRDVSFDAPAGKVTALLGRNGVGKTTLLRCLMGLHTGYGRTSGTITLAGEDVTRLPPHARARRGLGYVPDDRGIFATLSVEENLTLAPVLRSPGGPEPWPLERVYDGLAHDWFHPSARCRSYLVRARSCCADRVA